MRGDADGLEPISFLTSPRGTRSKVSNFAQTSRSGRAKFVQKSNPILGPGAGHSGTKTMLKNQNTNVVAGPPEARGWTQILARYRSPSPVRSIVELVITAGPFVLLWFLMWTTIDLCYWVSLLLAVPAAGFLVRLFMIQHDCGHGAFFHHRLVNDWVGRIIGVFTLTPYDFWRRTHAVHHATSGNLDRRGTGDIDTLTVHEYLALSRWRRLGYRIYRHPIIMFGLGPAFLFIVQHRLPVGLMRAGWQPWLSAMATNVAIAAVVATVIWLVGVVPFLIVHLPIMLLASFGRSLVVFMSSINSNVPNGLRDGAWNLQEAALHGSSVIMTCRVSCAGSRANIGVPSRPSSVQPDTITIVCHSCCAIYPELGVTGRLTLTSSELQMCAAEMLWDEGLQRLVSFDEVRQRYARV